ncbi:ARM repeat-containing protein, partial [Coemansia mojavensis]
MPTNASVIPTGLAKALSDKLYDKQRVATLKVERLVLEALDADDEQKIYRLVAELATDYATSERESARIGGLVALAATAVALTHINIRPFLPHMVPPMVSALSDGESKVRYFACESLYNVAKVSRGNILRWFNDIFDGLARVTADSVKTVKDGADYLDRLIKDIVAEQAATCLDCAPEAKHLSESNIAADDADMDALAGISQAPVLARGPRLAFSLEKFVPLLSERMHTYKPSTRLYLIEWIRVLDSVPGLDLVVYLPEFLDGLLRFLSDPSDDVRNKTQSLLGELLNEVRECVELQGMQQETTPDRVGLEGEEAGPLPGGSPHAQRQGDVHVEGRFSAESPQPYGYTYSSSGTPVSPIRAARAGASTVPGSRVEIDFARCVSILVPHIESNDQEIQGTALLWIYQFTWLCPQVIVAAVPTLVNAVLPSVSHPMPAHRRTAEDVNEQLYSLVQAAPDPVHRRVAKCPARNTQDGESKQLPLSSVNERPWLRPATRPLTPVTVTAPATAGAALASGQQPAASDAVNDTSSVVTTQQQAPPETRSRTGSMLQNAEPGSATASTVPSRVASPPPIQLRPANDEEEEKPQRRRDSNSEPPLLSGLTQLDISDNPEEYETVVDEPFNYEQAATAVMELFAKNVHEPTKVAGMQWLLLLHRKAPWRILTPEDMSFPVLLKMLGDSSEQVVKLDLELFAQISAYSQDGVYNGRMHLLQMFATDRVLLETRGALMVRQLCVVLDAQLVFCLFARLLLLPRFSEQTGLADLEFISIMVQHLSWVLVTAPETESLRLTLRRVIEQNQQSHGLFLALFGTWSHNSAACLTLCLLSQHYGVSAELVSVFGQLTQDLTVSFLVQLDKLVQLIESPVFTFLRLQLLDPAQHPRLLRTLYGLLMLLPQSSAFAILRNRLSTV